MLKPFIINLTLALCFLQAQAQTTRLTVRAKAKDAKFIGTAIGGAYVTVKNHFSGELLAKGLTTGASGNTELIMKQAIRRGQSVTDSTTASFIAMVDIMEPTLVDIAAIAPFNRKNAAVTSTTQVWLIPGKDILGEGVVLEFPGFILDILSPSTHEIIKLDAIKGNLKFKVSLTMMCGCAITKGGIWNSEDIEVKAIVSKNGVKSEEIPLLITTVSNIFEGNFKTTEKGNYEFVIYAYDRKTGNTGVDKINFVLE